MMIARRLQREDAWHGLSVMRLLEKPNNETPEIPTELKKRLKRTINNFKSLYSQVLSDQEGRVWSRYDNNDQNEEDEDEEDSSDEFSDTDEYDWQHWIPALMDYEVSTLPSTDGSITSERVYRCSLALQRVRKEQRRNGRPPLRTQINEEIRSRQLVRPKA
jgi:hypothetical protein